MKKKMLLMMLFCACMCMLTFTAMAATEGDWEYTVVDETAIVKSYTGSDTIIVVPSTLGGYPVIKLDHACFADNTNLTAITIPNTVTSLGAYCFSGCSSLTKITIPESVTVLEQFCFLQCPSLKSVSLPEGVQKIETGCFTECKSLAKLLIPKSVTYIGAININGKYLLLSTGPPRLFWYILPVQVMNTPLNSGFRLNSLTGRRKQVHLKSAHRFLMVKTVMK